MNESDREREIGELRVRMSNVESAIAEFRATQNKMHDDIHSAKLENTTMSSEIRWIRETLENMNRKKLRLVDVGLVVFGLIVSGAGLYAAFRSNQIAMMMLELSKKIP